jgi:hypothetical protein
MTGLGRASRLLVHSTGSQMSAGMAVQLAWHIHLDIVCEIQRCWPGHFQTELSVQPSADLKYTYRFFAPRLAAQHITWSNLGFLLAWQGFTRGKHSIFDNPALPAVGATQVCQARARSPISLAGTSSKDQTSLRRDSPARLLSLGLGPEPVKLPECLAGKGFTYRNLRLLNPFPAVHSGTSSSFGPRPFPLSSSIGAQAATLPLHASSRGFSSVTSCRGLSEEVAAFRGTGLPWHHAQGSGRGPACADLACWQQTRGLKHKVKFKGCKLKVYSSYRVRTLLPAFSQLAIIVHSF